MGQMVNVFRKSAKFMIFWFYRGTSRVHILYLMYSMVYSIVIKEAVMLALSMYIAWVSRKSKITYFGS